MHADEDRGSDNSIEDAPREMTDVVVVKSRRSADPSFAHSLGRRAMRLALGATNAGISTGRTLLRSAVESAPGQVVADIAFGALDALGRESGIDWDSAEQRVEEQLGRVVAVVAPVVVQSIDPEDLLQALDLNALMRSIDLNALLAQIDVDGLLARVDVDALLDRVDVDALLSRADIDGVVSRVDVNAVARRARIGELVAESSGDVAGSALDLGRRQAVALDTLLARSINRVLGRDASTMPDGPPALTEEEVAES